MYILFSEYSVGEHVLTITFSDAVGKTGVLETPFIATGMKYSRSCLTWCMHIQWDTFVQRALSLIQRLSFIGRFFKNIYVSHLQL